MSEEAEQGDALGRVTRLREALRQLLHEVIEAGFEMVTDYNWPKAIADAKAALKDEP